MPVLENYYEHLYHGPVVSLRGYCAHHRLQGSILAYLDFGGATGSAKDGLAEGMLALAAEQGLLAKGQPIVEASSGTFAVALTIAARHSGHPVTLTMPEGVPDERKKLLRSLGAQLAFSSPLDGRRGAERLARELAETQNGYYTNYFANDLNPEYHRRVTGPNILKETDSQLDAVVIGVGSGGTITGVGEYLRAWENTVKVVAVEPYESQAIGGGFPGRHGIAGLGAGFVPEVLDTKIYDEVIAVENDDAFAAGKQVGKAEGVLVGISSGAAVWAGIQLAKRPENQGKTIVVLLPDTGDRYLSTPLFAD